MSRRNGFVVVAVAAIGGLVSSGASALAVSIDDPPLRADGPDVVYSDMADYLGFAAGGVRAYTYGTSTCNIGGESLLWTSGGTPGVGFNLYRLHDGRLMQVGQGWVKIATFAAAGPGCGLTCSGQGGSRLGAGCRDTYSAGFNAYQPALKPRSQINPWTGTFGPTPGGGGGTVIDRRVQAQTSDLQLANFPGARFFAEGVYVSTDEEPAAKLNNASYKGVVISQTDFGMTSAPGFPMEVGNGAIYSWRDHGLGVNQPDPSVIVQEVDVPQEGRFVVAHKVRENGDGTWRYEYAVFNYNSHRSGGSFSVPVGQGAVVSNVGFHDVPYHSGEPYDNTDWSVVVGSGSVTWSSPQTFAQNADSNALRWGTMYNFWFDADQPPADAAATLGLFRPGTPDALAVMVGAPSAGGGDCPADWDESGTVNSSDISAFLTAWLASVTAPNLDADFNNDGATNSSDISAFLSAWLAAVQGEC